MGKLVNGKWVASEEQTRIGEKGDFVRGRTKFREWVRRDGSTPFAAEKNRYHLWVAHNCPWAHRTEIVRNLMGLTDAISMSVAHYRRDDSGWWFHDGLDDLPPENDKFALHRLYSMSSDVYEGSATVPVLWDRKERTIVSNESAEIIQMLNREFSEFSNTSLDLYPDDAAAEIDSVNEWVYDKINNGVYRCGFSRTQEAYERAFIPLFEALDEVDRRLGEHRYLVGNQVTLADVRLFTTLARFDAVYYSHFKCNRRRIVDYQNIWPYFRDLYQTPGFGETVKIDVYKLGYYGRSPGLNPRGIIPMGPDLAFDAPHDRAERPYGCPS